MSGFTSFNTLPFKVLVVEDEVLTRTSLAQILDSYFDEVHYADDGHIGLEMYYKIKPDIIFTDIVMPTMNGIDMIQQINKSDDHKPIIILFSAFDTTISAEELKEIGVFQMMVKPFKMKTLEKLIAEITAHKNLDQ